MRPGGFKREPCVQAAVAIANQPAVNEMSPNNGKRTLRQDLLLATAMLMAGVAVSGVALTRLRAAHDPQVAQATQPLQPPPSSEQDKPAAAESKPDGERPTTPAPEPARPDADAQNAGAPTALPPAPAEKAGAPIKER